MVATGNVEWKGLGSHIKWSVVGTKAERVLIVGAGPSLRREHLPIIDSLNSIPGANPVHVIAVNRIIQYLENVNSWFTLDPDDRVLPLMRAQREGVDYYAAVPDDYGLPTAAVKYHRIDLIEGVKWLKRITGKGPLKCKYGLSQTRNQINTGNSLWGAFGLAFHMRPKKIVLCGLDATQEPYGILDGAPRGDLSHLPNLFASSLGQITDNDIEVVNASLGSHVTCFEKRTFGAAVNWLLR